MNKTVLCLLALLSATALAAPASISPSMGVNWATVTGAKGLNFGSYKDTPYLRDAGFFKKAATELDRQWTAQGQKGRCNVKTAEIVSFNLAKAADFTALENAVRVQIIGGGMKVQALGADSPPKFFRISKAGKTVAMSFSRVFLPDQPPVLTLRTCQMQ